MLRDRPSLFSAPLTQHPVAYPWRPQQPPTSPRRAREHLLFSCGAASLLVSLATQQRMLWIDRQSFATGSRPSLSRLATDQILDYYRSDEADSGAAYTSNTIQSNPELSALPDSPPESASSPQSHSSRRTRMPSIAGADHRRVHIMELDASSPPTNGSPKSQGPTHQTSLTADADLPTFGSGDSLAATTLAGESSLLARRTKNNSQTKHSRLALVAPPDAAVASYTNLTPPDMLAQGSGPQSAPPRKQSYNWQRGAFYGSERSLADSRDNAEGEEIDSATKDNRRMKSYSIDFASRTMNINGSPTTTAGVFNRKRASQNSGRHIPRGEIVTDVSSQGSAGDTNAQGSHRDHLDAPPPASLMKSSSVPATPTAPVTPLVSSVSLTTNEADQPTRSHGHLHLVNMPSPQRFNSPIPEAAEMIFTPAIGESKDVSTRVAGPVVVDVANATRAVQELRTTPSPVASPPKRQATAPGAMTSPPPPPRPPRLHHPSSNGLRRLVIGSGSRDASREKEKESPAGSPLKEYRSAMKLVQGSSSAEDVALHAMGRSSSPAKEGTQSKYVSFFRAHVAYLIHSQLLF